MAKQAANPEVYEDPLEKMTRRVHDAVRRVVNDQLPGASEHVDNTPDIKAWIAKQSARAAQAMRDLDEILLDQAVGAWMKSWERVNEILAEEYRAKNTDPTLWELRYVKWMKISYIAFDSPLGPFRLYPRRPAQRPPLPHWYTAAEMIDILTSPGILATLEQFKALPVRPDSFALPTTGEQDLVVDITQQPMVVHAVVGRPYARYRE